MLNRVVDLESCSRPVKQPLSFEPGSLIGLLPPGPKGSALTACALQAAFGLSTADAASLAGCNRTYAALATRVAPEERGQVARGALKLYHTGCRSRPDLTELLQNASAGRFVEKPDPAGLTDAEFDQFLARAGKGRAWLDRVTAPAAAAE